MIAIPISIVVYLSIALLMYHYSKKRGSHAEDATALAAIWPLALATLACYHLVFRPINLITKKIIYFRKADNEED